MTQGSVILLYGNTCAGKSTLGRQLEAALGAKYLSFGDLKRAAIHAGTTEGKALRLCIEGGKPIDPTMGARVISAHFGAPLNCLSGYPISSEELTAFKVVCGQEIMASVLLSITEDQARERFRLRATCPECQYPGCIQDHCPVHQVALIKREDATGRELISRFRLFEERILPFFESTEMDAYPKLCLEVAALDREAVLNQTMSFLRRTTILTT
jgi:adenylate kinase family enzyme